MRKKIIPAKKIRDEIATGYNRDPEGWSVFVGRDKENYLSSVFMHKSRMWMIKEFAINPYRFIGCGIKTRFSDEFSSGKYPFGLRPLTTRQEDELRNGNSSIIEEILNKSPVSEVECSNSLVLEGPIITSERPIVISNKQEKLDLMLRRSLRSLIKRKHSDFFRSYI